MDQCSSKLDLVIYSSFFFPAEFIECDQHSDLDKGRWTSRPGQKVGIDDH